MFRAIGRLIVATAAGAGLGAAAAIAKNRFSETGGGGVWADEPAASMPHTRHRPPSTQSDGRESVAEPMSPVLVSEPPPPPPDPAPAAATNADIADLDDARRRLRERAAELRAEMERQAGP